MHKKVFWIYITLFLCFGFFVLNMNARAGSYRGNTGEKSPDKKTIEARADRIILADILYEGYVEIAPETDVIFMADTQPAVSGDHGELYIDK